MSSKVDVVCFSTTGNLASLSAAVEQEIGNTTKRQSHRYDDRESLHQLIQKLKYDEEENSLDDVIEKKSEDAEM